MKYLKGTREF
ncbi:hypothetical protein EMCRGX_G009316 [Ephydatia muelleri]